MFLNIIQNCYIRWLLPEVAQDEEVEDNFGNGFCAPTQRQLWNLFENPHHSKAAKVPIQIREAWKVHLPHNMRLHLSPQWAMLVELQYVFLSLNKSKFLPCRTTTISIIHCIICVETLLWKVGKPKKHVFISRVPELSTACDNTDKTSLTSFIQECFELVSI